VLYAAGQPSFVIDANTRRIFSRIGIRPAHDAYEGWRAMFMGALPADAAMFNEYHALIVAHGKAVCRKEPRCLECVLRDVCETGRNRPGERRCAVRGHQVDGDYGVVEGAGGDDEHVEQFVVAEDARPGVRPAGGVDDAADAVQHAAGSKKDERDDCEPLGDLGPGHGAYPAGADV
jgi:hypothetical protein